MSSSAAPVEPESKRIEPTPVLPSGIEAGLFAGVAVAAVFLARDWLAGAPLQTPSVLGTLLIEGADAAKIVVWAPGAAAAYTALHFALWVLAGGIGIALMHRVEADASRWHLPWVAVGLLTLFCVAIDAWAARTGLPRLHLWLGGLAGVAAMTVFFHWRHPHAMARVRSFGAD